MRKKINNKGFAITSFLYAILMVFLVIFSVLLMNMINSKLSINKLKESVRNEVEDNYIGVEDYVRLIVEEKETEISIGDNINLLDGVYLKRYDDEILDTTINYVSSPIFDNTKSGIYYINYFAIVEGKSYTNTKKIIINDAYTINYNLNGGSASNPISYTKDTETFTLANPTRTGYTFTGWTGTGLSSVSTSVIIPKGSTGDRTYTANWSAATYTIAYNCNGGSGSTASSTHTVGVAKNLTSNGCSKAMVAGTAANTSVANAPMIYYFAGWSTSSSATNATYTNGQSVTNVGTSGTVTLYAVWEPLFTYNQKYQVINDGGANWRVKFLEGVGTFTPTTSVNIDIFCVGGGGGGNLHGGGGGYTTTVRNKTVTATSYTVTIGGGGAAGGGRGGTSSFGSLASAAGGYGGYSDGNKGGAGGSGGGSYGGAGAAGMGGSDGGSSTPMWFDVDNGNGTWTWSPSHDTAVAGQGTTTSEFGETGGTLYSGGGGGGANKDNGKNQVGYTGVQSGYGGSGGGGGGACRKYATSSGNFVVAAESGGTNTGGGGGGGNTGGYANGAGGSGIVVIRNKR